MSEAVGKTQNVDGKGDGSDCIEKHIADLSAKLTLLEKNIERTGKDCVSEAEAKKLIDESEDETDTSETDDEYEYASSHTDDEEEIDADLCDLHVDVLVATKPIKEFKEFNFDFDDVLTNPGYKIGIPRISSLVKLEDVELLGNPFEISGLGFSMQIKCVVNYDKFQLFVAYTKSEKDVILFRSPRIVTAIIHSLGPQINAPDGLFCYNFPEGKEIVSEIFYPFCTFSYERNIAGISTLDQDYIILHFLTRYCCSKNDVLVEDGILLWKVDALISKLKAGGVVEEEDEVGLSPVFHKDPDGMRVQVRLFTRGAECMVQVIFYNETEKRLDYPRIDFKILHPKKPSRSIDFAFDPVERQLVDLEPRKPYSVSFQFSKVEQLVAFVDRYLWVKVKM